MALNGNGSKDEVRTEVLDVILHIVRSNAECVQGLVAATAALQAEVGVLKRRGEADSKLAVEIAELRAELRSRPTVRQLLSAVVTAATLAGAIAFGLIQAVN